MNRTGLERSPSWLNLAFGHTGSVRCTPSAYGVHYCVRRTPVKARTLTALSTDHSPEREPAMATTWSQPTTDSMRRTALVAGILYLLTFAASIPAVFLMG